MQGFTFFKRSLLLSVFTLSLPLAGFTMSLSPVPIDSVCDLSSGANVIGLATDSETKDPLYCEYHFDEYTDGAITRSRVEYIDVKQQTFAEKEIDFSMMPLAPNVIQRDSRQGELRTMTYLAEEQQFLLEYQKDDAADKKSARLNKTNQPPNVADAGFDLFIKEKWSPLLFGQSVELAFLSPVHTRGFTLKVRLDNRKTCGGIDYSPEQSVCFSVTPKSSLLKLFAKPLDLLYNRESKQLEVFSGVVNLVDDQGNSKNANIYYWHKP